MADHLQAQVRPYLDRPIGERLAFIKAPRWIGYTNALDILGTLHELLERPTSHRPPGLTIVGPFCNGKTMVVDRFAALMLQRPDKRQEVWLVQTAEAAGLGHFYASIVRAFQAPSKANRALEVKAQQVHELLNTLKPRMLIFDEFHNVLRGRVRDIEAVFAFLRRLGREYGIAVVLVGDIQVEQYIYAHGEMASRMTRCRMPRWQPDEEFLTLLDSLEAALPLEHASDLSSPRLADPIFELSEGLIGETVDIVTRASVVAIKSAAERITPEIIEALDYSPLSRRMAQDAEDLAGLV